MKISGCLFLLAAALAGAVADVGNFVRVDDGKFVIGDSKEEFPVSGFNIWEAVEAGTGASDRPEGSTLVGTQYVQSVFDVAQNDGFTVVRIFAHGVTPEYSSMDAQGNGIEDMLIGLDRVVASAKDHGLKLILSFVSNWTPAGGVDSFAENLGGTHNDFFTRDDIKNAYKNWVRNVLTRQNTVTGIVYAEDPTVFAWNLINEPQCRNCDLWTLQSWIEEMCGFVKSIDKNHLVTVGEEGYYHLTEGSISSNPQYGVSDWPQEWRQDFVEDHISDCIDFATFHAWVDNWSDPDKSDDDLGMPFFLNWINQHVEDTSLYLNGKPVLLEEFGKTNTPDRADFFKAAYDAVEENVRQGGPLRGALYWQYYVPGQIAEWYEEDPIRGPWGIYREDAAHQIAASNAAAIKNLSRK